MRKFCNVVSFCAAVIAGSVFAGTTSKDAEFKPELQPGWKSEIFVAAPDIDSPTSVAATPEGSIFVGEDPNNVRGHEQGTGKIKLCIDTDGDGKADKITVFADKTNGPRGMTFVDGTLYAVHTPLLTAFRDEDGDGVAEKVDILIKGLGPLPEKVPPDHSISGIRMGIDGWLYISCGDQGVPNGEGKDGSKVQLHGGGVVRIRPDGTELEIYCSGLRNTYDMSIDPYLNGFTRDNTNDGDGWNVRFSHIVSTANYGYPTLYMNYSDELLPPLADYGGGSGTGSMWIQENGFPKDYNNNLYTSDWGRGRIYRMLVEPAGSTFKPTQDDTFYKGGRPVDIDADTQGHLFVAEWGNRIPYGKNKDLAGAIVRVSHPESKPIPFPKLDKLSDEDLLKQIGAYSMTTRVAAQRVLLRRGEKPLFVEGLEKMAAGSDPLYVRVTALFTLKQLLGTKSHAMLQKYLENKELREFAIRALADRKSQLDNVTPQPFLNALKDADPRVRVQSIVALNRLGKSEYANALVPMLADPDVEVKHVAMRALRALNGYDACLDFAGKSPEVVKSQFIALREMHNAKAVAAISAKFGAEKEPMLRLELIRTLGRLYNREGEWDGSWWGIRPDTRGPYYKPSAWEQTPTIQKVLIDAMNGADETSARAALDSIAKFRLTSPEILSAVTAVAGKAGPVQADAVAVLVQMKELGAEAAAVLEKLALATGSDIKLRADALNAFERVQGDEKTAVLSKLVPQLAATPELQASAFGVLMKLKDQKAKDEVAAAWKDTKLAHSLVMAVGKARAADQLDKVRAALADQRPEVRKAAVETVAELKDGAAVSTLADLAEKNTDAAEAVKAIAKIGAAKVGAPHFNAVCEKLVALAEKSANGADKNLAHDAADLARSFCGDKRLKQEDAKKLTARIPHTAGAPVNTVRLADLKYEEITEKVSKIPGDKAVGEALFTKQTCVNCHTLNPNDKPKGPFLGDIGVRYQRKELMESVLKPSANIAFGFNTNLFTMDDGSRFEGFVVRESGDEVEVRNISGEVKVLPKAKISKRVVQKMSTMPEGLVDPLSPEEFASLMAFLESLKTAGQ